jgi:hypothetical protein
MVDNKQGNRPSASKYCAKCHHEVKTGKEYFYNSMFLCEECCIEIRTPLARKTHWQYIRSIKAEYLVPGKSI